MDKTIKLPHLILASASPRRRELLGRTGREFAVEVSGADENVPENIAVHDTAEYLSNIKADDVFERHAAENEDITVIGSDTVVILDGVIFGKPHGTQDAHRMLKQLGGRTHEVRTGVTVISGRQGKVNFKKSFTSRALVTFYELSDGEIDEYIATGEPMDKAGAYGIQGYGSLLIKEIHGDYCTVMGLPLGETYRLLRRERI